jgi:hypothetical protein
MVGLADTMVDHHSLARSPSWASRDGEGRSGSKGGEGCDGGCNRCPPRKWVPFSADPPRLVRRNDLKDASKARCSSSTNSSSVAISSTKNVTEYHAVALVSTPQGHP